MISYWSNYWSGYEPAGRIKQNREEVREEITETEKSREEWLIQTYHRDYASDLYGRALTRLSKIETLLELGTSVTLGPGGIYVNEKYVVGYQKNRWRVDGKATWYWYKTLDDLVKRYINN